MTISWGLAFTTFNAFRTFGEALDWFDWVFSLDGGFGVLGEEHLLLWGLADLRLIEVCYLNLCRVH